MSRIAFCETGFVDAGDTPTESVPVVGWWMMEVPVLNPGFTGDSNNPTGFSVEDYRKLYWNISEITLTYDILDTPGDGSPPVTLSGTLVMPETNAFTALPMTDEQDLVRARGNASFAASDANMNFEIDFGFRAPGTQYDPNGNPPIWPAGFDLSFNYPNPPLANGVARVNPFTTSGFFSCPVILSSVSLPWINSLVLLQSSDPSDPTTAALSGTITVEASAYWGYSGVFDPVSGVQILIPPPQGL